MVLTPQMLKDLKAMPVLNKLQGIRKPLLAGFNKSCIYSQPVEQALLRFSGKHEADVERETTATAERNPLP